MKLNGKNSNRYIIERPVSLKPDQYVWMDRTLSQDKNILKISGRYFFRYL